MAEERLTLVDGMSASLRRIYQEAERLNRRMLTLKTDIKSLEKPMSLSYLRKELKETELQAKLTESALKRAVRVGEREGILSWNRRYGGIQYLNSFGQNQYIKDADLVRYGQRLQQVPLRRNRMLWNNGRIVNDMTFEQRVQARHPYRNFSKQLTEIGNHFGNLGFSSESLVDKFLRVGSSIAMFGYALHRVTRVIDEQFIKPQSQYISNMTRIALTNDSKLTPKEMTNRLYDTAMRTRAPADATFMLYNRVALSGVKASNERIRRFVESFNKVTAISGTTGQENRAVMLQLAQGIGSNRLGGDEFRSISEQAPLFKYMLAKGLAVNPGALKQMGAEGKLTAEAILSAMEKVQDEIDLIFKEAPITIDQAITILHTKWQKMLNDQFTGYIAIRDLIKDITLWMDTPRGKETISAIITGWNKLMMNFAKLVRMVAPFVLWLFKHMKQIAVVMFTWITLMTTLRMVWAGFQLLVTGFRLYEWFISATEGAVLLRTALSGIGPIILSWLIPLAQVLAALGAVIMTTMALKKINNEFDYKKIREEQQDKDAYFRFERDIDNYINTKYRMPEYMVSKGSTVKLTPEEKAAETEMSEKRARALQMKDYLIYQYNEAQKRGVHLQFKPEMMDPFAMNGLKGMADSSKNVPMVGKVKEVGKVNDKISIDNDGIEMMKAIAERQWVMQNEVSVPQQVDVHISKEVDVSEERIAEAIIGGTKIAVASSMRGAPA